MPAVGDGYVHGPFFMVGVLLCGVNQRECGLVVAMETGMQGRVFHHWVDGNGVYWCMVPLQSKKQYTCL